jgi:dolichol-phosphate mannosyltransferase
VVCNLAIVVPVFNEEGNILPLAEEVSAALGKSRWSYELILVDDASTDGTWQAILQAQKRDPRIRGLRHSRNSGQSAALWTGLRATAAPFIATMDGDCQNDPADFPKLLEHLKDCDFVCGVRTKRQDRWIRLAAAKVARRARKWVLRVDFIDTGCGLRVFKREIIDQLFPFNGLHRFMPVLVHGAGAKTLELPVSHRPRPTGVSKYGIWDRLGRGIVDLFAMAWYQRRRIRPVPFEHSPSVFSSAAPRVVATGDAPSAPTPAASDLLQSSVPTGRR